MERSKFISKVEHLKKLRKEREEELLQECPHEIIDYKEIKVFKKEEMDKMRKEGVEVSKIGDVKLDDDEISINRFTQQHSTQET